jgi:uncharacterized protein YkwD
MLSRRSGVRTGTRVGSGLAALALVCLLTMSLALGGARSAQAVVGDCVPGSNWGTPDTSFAAQVLTLVNQHRTAMGLSALSTSPTLTASAQWKSLHMAYYGYMDHNDPAPPVARTWVDRIVACGYTSFFTAGENIAYGYQTPQAVMDAWLNSPGHRANIESPSYAAIGIGAVRASNGLWFWTQDFGSFVDGGGGGGGGGVTAPTVTLTSVPGSSTTSTSATFGWTTTGSPTGTTCSLDGAFPTACSTPTSYSGLAVGSHSFLVTVSNSAGSNSVSYNWTVTSSGTRPTVTLTSTPAASTTSTSASFAWTTTGSPTGTTCSLDGAFPSACSSPAAYSGLAIGTHTFVVTVSNGAGSNSASYSWTVTSSGSAPTVSFSSTPTASNTSPNASFSWTTTGSVTGTTCSLDGAFPSACSSPASLSGLEIGTHTFVVTVSNGAGSGSASYSWTVKAAKVPPTVSFTRVPAAGATRAKFAWKTTHLPTSITCSVDGAPATPCTSPTTFTVAAGTSHTLVVTATNAAGSGSASYTW